MDQVGRLFHLLQDLKSDFDIVKEFIHSLAASQADSEDELSEHQEVKRHRAGAQ